jgi:nucleoside-diphosphate-sugar epimerase
VYNIASGRSYSVNELLEALVEVVGRSRVEGVEGVEGIAPRRVAARAGDVRYSVADIGRAREKLGYEVKVGFREGLERTVRWFRERGG